jgi:N6-adenosine-specific RNA methylase IME4
MNNAVIDFPSGVYDIIYADPPWSYNDKAAAGKRGAGFKYPTQSKEWLCSLPVANMAATNSVLFMWVTNPLLPVGLEVISAWGFQYKTVGFTWVKQNKVNGGYFKGMGNWTRANPELCLLGVRGKPKRISASVDQLIVSKLRGHSQKPPEVRDRIIELMGDLPRIELFAREKSPCWKVWGNDANLLEHGFKLETN